MIGKWRCPMFRCPTKLGLDVMQIGAEQGYSGMDLALRIAHPGDKIAEVFRSPQAVRSHYKLADYHVEQANPGSVSMTLDHISHQQTPTKANN